MKYYLTNGDVDIVTRYTDGETQKSIALSYGLTRSRIGQIVDIILNGILKGCDSTFTSKDFYPQSKKDYLKKHLPKVDLDKLYSEGYFNRSRG